MTHLARFPKSGFVLPCPDGQDLVALPGRLPDGRRTICIGTGSEDTGHAQAAVPLDRLEEVIAGLREIARQQAADQPMPPAGCQCIAQTTAAPRIHCDPCRTGSASEQSGSAA
ncbi:hypothetical protein [Streptomyces sp. NPDC051577]|uniref:hypothetical protein n=1 Tax=Streptomyces sp. NPDC051577 TaxID=3155166 RepID=UPI003418922B